jgi:hypothetical protein
LVKNGMARGVDAGGGSSLVVDLEEWNPVTRLFHTNVFHTSGLVPLWKRLRSEGMRRGV